MARKKRRNFVNPYVQQYTMSFLERVDRTARDRVCQLMINHRQEGGLEWIASRIAYGGRMVSARDAFDGNETTEWVHTFLENERYDVSSQKVAICGGEGAGNLRRRTKQEKKPDSLPVTVLRYGWREDQRIGGRAGQMKLNVSTPYTWQQRYINRRSQRRMVRYYPSLSSLHTANLHRT